MICRSADAEKPWGAHKKSIEKYCTGAAVALSTAFSVSCSLAQSGLTVPVYVVVPRIWAWLCQWLNPGLEKHAFYKTEDLPWPASKYAKETPHHSPILGSRLPPRFQPMPSESRWLLVGRPKPLAFTTRKSQHKLVSVEMWWILNYAREKEWLYPKKGMHCVRVRKFQSDLGLIDNFNYY